MKHWYTPDWLLSAIGAMLRFVVGGFGISLPHPVKIRFCGYFWLALLGCTVGLPIVLLGWAIRLIFGKGRAENIFDALCDWLEYSPSGKFFGKMFVALLIGLALLYIGLLTYQYGWLVVLVVLTVTALVGLVTGVSVGAMMTTDRILDWSHSRPSKTKKRGGLLAKSLAVIIWPPKTILLGLWFILAFIGMQIYAGYKNICPVVEFP